MKLFLAVKRQQIAIVVTCSIACLCWQSTEAQAVQGVFDDCPRPEYGKKCAFRRGALVSVSDEEITIGSAEDNLSFVISAQTKICIDGRLSSIWATIREIKAPMVVSSLDSDSGNRRELALEIHNRGLTGGISESGKMKVIFPQCSHDPAKDRVKKIQSALNKLGFAVGTPDGIAGEKTRAGISSYQQAAGFEVSGVLTEDQFNMLMLNVENDQ